MSEGDFFGSEQSHVMSEAGEVRIELHSGGWRDDGAEEMRWLCRPAKSSMPAVMSRDALRAFLGAGDGRCQAQDVLLSLHLKATMMKVSDPIIFGHAVSVFFDDVFEKHADVFDATGHRIPTTALAIVYAKIAIACRDQQASEIKADIDAVYAKRPALGDGRFGQRHHQSARAQRRDHRRLHAGGHPLFGKDVGTGRQAARHQSGDSRSLLCRHLSGDDRLLQTARCV